MRDDRHWHAIGSDEALHALDSRPSGLTEAEAAERMARFGPNLLPPPRRRGPWLRLLLQFHNVLIYVLLAAGVVTLLLGHGVDAAVIIGVVIINAWIGFVQEGKAERALEAVSGMLSPRAAVIRDGRRLTLPAEQLVPGDVVFLQSGDRVPADLRLFHARELRIDESMLTGESVPAEKSPAPVAADAPLGDRAGMAYSGTMVTFGQGSGVVAGAGTATEIGRISTLLAGVQTLETPLTRQMALFARVLTTAILVLAALTGVFGVAVQGYAPSEMFLAAVGLAVAAIPEGLPAIITITLAIGVRRMADRRAIIRRLPAVETLGSVTTICSDKTGTLTRNEMTVTSVVLADGLVQVSGGGYDPHGGFTAEGADLAPEVQPVLRALCRAGMLCNDAQLQERDGAWLVEGDPTDGALVVLGRKAGFEPALLAEELPREDVIPFESQYRFMATLHHDHAGGCFLCVKGAPEAVLERCAWERTEADERPLDHAGWSRQVERLAGEGQRTLAIAVKAVDGAPRPLRFADLEGGLTLLGLTGMIDPPREEAISAVAQCRAAGIQVRMITGDHAITAQAIARAIGLGEGSALTGQELERLDDAALRERVGGVRVFARASPEHKLRLVTAFQARGEVVAMTGDGVNDAPALKRADVGVAMGVKGTEAARQAAEMVLADDNFASIAHAVEEGRTVYDNIRKSILFILPTNGGEALTLIAAILLGLVLPVTAPQILWVNMITAVTLALSLAFEPAERDVMGRPPRDPAAPLLDGFMIWRVVFVSVLMVAVTFGLFLWEQAAGGSLEASRTVAVNALVTAEAFYLLASRYLTAPSLTREGLLGNPFVPLSIALVMAFQLLFTYLPLMQGLFATAPIGLDAWWRILVGGVAVLLLVELEKWAMRRWRLAV